MGDRQREGPESGGSWEGRKRGQGAPERDSWLGVPEEREERSRGKGDGLPPPPGSPPGSELPSL